ncbi:MAG: hypothetical protein LBB67_03020 [Oscillospiraceae bacterium]|nr:hypothetical protein [Oscillospiraceae bacterium]
MMKASQKIVAVVFISLISAMILVPLALFKTGYLVLESENRKAAYYHEVSNEGFKGFETYFSDRLGFRSSLIRVYAVLHHAALESIGNRDVFLAKNGWMFLTAEFNLEIARGGYPLSNAQAEENALAERVIADYYAKRGTAFFATITPSKAAIYSEYIDENIDPQSLSTPADRQLEAYRAAGVQAINVKPRLLAQRDTELSFQQYDAHWTQYGAYLAYCELLSHIMPDSDPITITKWKHEGTSQCDMANQVMRLGYTEMIPIASYQFHAKQVKSGAFYDALQAQVDADNARLKSERKSDERKTIISAVYENPDAVGGTLLVYGDSMWFTARGLPRFFAEHFKRVVVITLRPAISPGVDDLVKPDVVIHSHTERFCKNGEAIRATRLLG